ncbi:hypothetical protein Tco_0121194 [Tanacetum coccineum]
MVGDLCDSIRIKLVTTGKKQCETVTHWFTLIVLSALRHSDNENMLSTMNLIHVSFFMDLRYEHVSPKVRSSQDGKKRLCLVDDLKVLRSHTSHYKSSKSNKLKLKSMITTQSGLRNTVGSGAGGGSLGGGSGEGAFVVSRGEVVTVSGFGTAVVVVVETRLSEDVGLWGMVHWWLVVGSGGKLLGDKIAGVVWALNRKGRWGKGIMGRVGLHVGKEGSGGGWCGRSWGVEGVFNFGAGLGGVAYAGVLREVVVLNQFNGSWFSLLGGWVGLAKWIPCSTARFLGGFDKGGYEDEEFWGAADVGLDTIGG